MERTITIIFKTPSHNIKPCHSQNTQTSFATNLMIGLPKYGLKATNFDGIIYKGCCKNQITTTDLYESRSNIACTILKLHHGFGIITIQTLFNFSLKALKLFKIQEI